VSLQYEKPEEENEPQITPEEFLREHKSTIRKRSFWAIGIGSLLIFVHLALFAIADVDFSLLFRSIFFILGLFAVAGGFWGLYEARRMTMQDLIPSPEAILFAQQAELSNPYFTYVLVACIVTVTLCQMTLDLDQSVEIAGFVKSDFANKGEFWRILTGATLHGGVLHLYFNGQALYGFGSLIEFLSNRAHLAIVFLLAIIGGGILSLFLMPDVASIGASGGIMGLIGYLAIYGYRRKQQLPPDFLKSMLINVGFIAAFGIIAYQIVDNFAHLGGLLTGAIYGFVQIPRDLHKNPRQASTVTKIFGFVALAIFVLTSIFTVLLLLKFIKM
jgi:rhomboid protease GluP